MSIPKGPTEGGSGGKKGHSNAERWGTVRFIETVAFTRRVVEVMSDDEYSKLQQALLARPTHGTLIPVTGGARKIRWGDLTSTQRRAVGNVIKEEFK
jgi:hypothetical protein